MVTINLEDNEINIWTQICDRALRNSGMDVFDAVAHFRNKIINAQNQQRVLDIAQQQKGNGLHEAASAM